MTSLEMPIFLIADRDGWLCLDVGPDLSGCLAFGTRDDAQKYLEHNAERRGLIPSLFRIVKYNFSGEVFEG